MRKLLVSFGALFLLALSASLLLWAQGSHTFIVRGSVVDAEGAPVASAVVQLYGFDGASLGSQLTDGMGGFTFLVSSPGPYQANVMTPSGTEQLSLPAGTFQNITLRLHSVQSLARANSASGTVSLNDLAAPGKARSEVRQAEKAMKKSDLAKAWSLVNAAIRRAPNWGRAYMLRGVLSFSLHNYDSARNDFSTAVARDPDNALALTLLGKLYNTTGKRNLSRVYLQRALQLPPVQWPTYLEMAELDLEQRDYAGAGHMATLAEGCRPSPPPAIHYLAALAASGLHNVPEARKQFALYLAQAPRTPATARARAAAQRHLQALARLQPPIR